MSDYRAKVTRCLPDWLDRDIKSITKNEVEERHAQLSCLNSEKGKGTAMANYAFKVVRALFSYAIHKYEVDGVPYVSINPVNRLSELRAWNRIADGRLLLAIVGCLAGLLPSTISLTQRTATICCFCC